MFIFYFALQNIFVDFQSAMKEQNIEFKDIEKDILGSDEECKIPPKMEKPSWQFGKLICFSSPLALIEMVWTDYKLGANGGNIKQNDKDSIRSVNVIDTV